MSAIDRSKVRESFHRQAGDYDRYAVVQKRVVQKLAATVEKEAAGATQVLDIGCGTGNLLLELRRRLPNASFTGIDLAPAMIAAAREKLGDDRQVTLLSADAERLPLPDGRFELATSASTFQWLPALVPAFSEARRVLAADGTFCFALFGRNTLYELRTSYRKALERLGGEGDRTHRFHDVSCVLHSLAEAGFSDCRAFSELEVEYHSDVPTLLKAIRNIGAGNASSASGRGLGERRVMMEMMEIYRAEFGGEEGIPATYEVIYGFGRKA